MMVQPLLRRQRSHVLYVLSNAAAGREADFLNWYQGVHRRDLQACPGVLSAQHYERHAVDITRGKYPPLPFRFLGLYELCLDGAQEAAGLIDRIKESHQQGYAQPPATWLYYPACEKVGRAPCMQPSLLTLAFANGLPGQEDEFREWYATRHIRHALNIPALVSGQCFARTSFQRPGALEARFSVIAVYEQEGAPESLIESFRSLAPETFHFPMLDKSRFAEWVYQPVL